MSEMSRKMASLRLCWNCGVEVKRRQLWCRDCVRAMAIGASTAIGGWLVGLAVKTLLP